MRYGRQFAAFLPAVLLCEQWRMVAQVHTPHAPSSMTYQLNETSSLRTHFKTSGEFDSALERNFAQEFEEKFGGRRSHGILNRESTVLLLGDTVMIPDFVLVDKADENRQIIIELVGFWHETYLKRKVAKVREAQCQNLLLLVYQGLKLTPDAFRETVSEVIFFQQKPVIKDVMGAVEALSERLYGPRPTHKGRKAASSKEDEQIIQPEQVSQPSIVNEVEPEQKALPSPDNCERVRAYLGEYPNAKVREVAGALSISIITSNK